MAIRVDAAEIAVEYVEHNEEVVTFSTGGPENTPNEVVTLDVLTWKRMGYPHLMTFVGKTTK